jgi:hypothetical protein
VAELPEQHALVAITAQGRVHAACLDGANLRELGTVEREFSMRASR